MSVASSIFGAINYRFSYGVSDDINDERNWHPNSMGQTTKSGINVGPETAMGLSAYYACGRARAEDLAKIPLEVIEKKGPQEKVRAEDHNLWPILNEVSNPNMTAFSWREVTVHRSDNWGYGRSYIQRALNKKPVALWPIHPTRINLKMDSKGIAYYEVSNDDDGKKATRLEAADVLDLHQFGGNGLTGYPLSALAKESIALGLQSETFAGSFFKNDATPGVTIVSPDDLTPDDMTSMKLVWDQQNMGAEKAHSSKVMGGNVTIERLSIPPNEAQLLETRQYQGRVICQWYRIPPEIMGMAEQGGATHSNLESLLRDYVLSSLMPTAVRFEQELNRKLLTDAEREKFYIKHNFDAFMRGDVAKRMLKYRTLFGTGSYSANRILAEEDENGIGADGDMTFIPANMVPLEQAVKEPEPVPVMEPIEPDEDKGNNEPNPADRDKEQDKDRKPDGEAVAAAFEPLLQAANARVITKFERAADNAHSKLKGKSLDKKLSAIDEMFDSDYVDAVGSVISAACRITGTDPAPIVALKSHDVSEIMELINGTLPD